VAPSKTARRRQASNRLLRGSRVYLSGPMDFVASRETEQKEGWRTRLGQFLGEAGAVVFDPWNKPEARGLHGYGRETPESARAREAWTFKNSRAGAQARAKLTGHYWETLHIDRLERKPVLFVSPPIEFPSYDALAKHLVKDAVGTHLLNELKAELPIKPNERGIPSLWYMPLVGGESFFDGFGFQLSKHRKRYGWKDTPIDEMERGRPPVRPLLPFLEALNERLPTKWDNKRKTYVRNDDWLLWNISKSGKVEGPH
jgi:hypothetical protein